jgi:hypothetical protein
LLWNWYYLESWSDERYRGEWRDHVSTKYRSHRKWCIEHVRPVKYHTPGLKESSIRSLLSVGCKPNRKCKCVNVIQRGYWYCPKCWKALNAIAQSRNQHIHDLMIQPRQELKADLLILTLSGVI